MPTVSIRRIRTNFQIRFNYDEDLIKHIKSISKEQIKTECGTIIQDGKPKKDWFHVCNIHGLMKVLWYCQEKHIQYSYENLSEKDIWKVEEYVLKRKEKLLNVKKFRNGDYDKEIEEEDYSFMKIQPYLYQKKGVKFFELTDGLALLGDEPGVGKTLTAISYSIKNKFKTIIICPASLVLVWAKEILKFTYEKPYIFKYKISKTHKLDLGTAEESNIHIVSYNALDTYLKFDVHHKCQNAHCDFDEISQVKKIKSCPKCFRENSVKSRNTDLLSFSDKKGVELKTTLYDLVVLDECHYVKNIASNRTKLIRSAFKATPKKVLLSGTAIKNNTFEFFPILNFLDPFEFVNQHAYGVRYSDGKVDEWDHWHYDGATNIEELVERISPLYLRRRKSDPGILEYLPPKTFTTIPITLTPEEAREYKKIENQVVGESSDEDDKITHLARIQKLKFFTSKICAQRAQEFIKNIIDGDEKIIVFSQYIETSRMIHERFEKNSVWYTGKKSANEKEDARESFMSDDNIKVFSGTIGAAGVGLTLTSSSTVMFLDLPWTHADFVQACDRAHRASQKNQVQIITLIVQDTIDEDVYELINQKERVTSQVLDGEFVERQVSTSIFDDLVQIILKKKKN